jgi:hypothetical protein
MLAKNNMFTKKIKITITLLVVLMIFASFIIFLLYFEEKEDTSTKVDNTATIVPTGNTDSVTDYMVAPDGKKSFFLEREYTLVDKSGIPVDASLISSIQIKYPGSADFKMAPITMINKDVFVYFVIWPPMTPGEYLFKLEYNDGKMGEEIVNWQEPKEIVAQTTGDKDVLKGSAYRLGELDLTSFDEMYYVNPSGIGTKIENPGDKYFWLKDSDAVPGNHAVLVKKDGVWYISKIKI